MATHEDVDDEFFNVIADLELDLAVPSIEDVWTIKLAAGELALNSFEGEDVRSTFANVFARAVDLGGLSQLEDDLYDQAAVEKVTQIAKGFFDSPEVSPSVGRHFHRTFAVTGRGLFMATLPGSTSQQILPLADSQVLIGRLDGAPFGKFAWTSPDEVKRYEQDDDVNIRYGSSIGGMILLNSARVHGLNGESEFIDFSERSVSVPVQVQDFSFYRVYELG